MKLSGSEKRILDAITQRPRTVRALTTDLELSGQVFPVAVHRPEKAGPPSVVWGVAEKSSQSAA